MSACFLAIQKIPVGFHMMKSSNFIALQTAQKMTMRKTFRLCSLVFLLTSLLFSCSSPQSLTNSASTPGVREFLLRDEGLSQLSYVNLARPEANWHQPIPPGRDIQLVGSNRVLIGTGTGYEERDITTGEKVFEQTSFNGTIAARRLRNGHTLLVGLNWKGKQGIVLIEADSTGNAVREIVYPGFTYVRLVRQTPSGTFLVTADDTVFEGTADGVIIWRARLQGREKPHAWQAVRRSDGTTLVSGGFTANFQLFDRNGNVIDSIKAPDSVRPHFFSGYQILQNGNYAVTNWQGHGPKFGQSGVQLLVFSPSGKLVWSWKQDAAKFSSLQGVVVLDGLDKNFLHVEDEQGKLVAVKTGKYQK